MAMLCTEIQVRLQDLFLDFCFVLLAVEPFSLLLVARGHCQRRCRPGCQCSFNSSGPVRQCRFLKLAFVFGTVWISRTAQTATRDAVHDACWLELQCKTL